MSGGGSSGGPAYGYGAGSSTMPRFGTYGGSRGNTFIPGYRPGFQGSGYRPQEYGGPMMGYGSPMMGDSGQQPYAPPESTQSWMGPQNGGLMGGNPTPAPVDPTRGLATSASPTLAASNTNSDQAWQQWLQQNQQSLGQGSGQIDLLQYGRFDPATGAWSGPPLPGSSFSGSADVRGDGFTGIRDNVFYRNGNAMIGMLHGWNDPNSPGYADAMRNLRSQGFMVNRPGPASFGPPNTPTTPAATRPPPTTPPPFDPSRGLPTGAGPRGGPPTLPFNANPPPTTPPPRRNPANPFDGLFGRTLWG